MSFQNSIKVSDERGSPFPYESLIFEQLLEGMERSEK